jgi:hypothetical protein
MTNIEIKQFCLDGDRNTLKMFRRNSEHLDQVVQNDLLDKFVCSEVVHRPNALYHDEIKNVTIKDVVKLIKYKYLSSIRCTSFNAFGDTKNIRYRHQVIVNDSFHSM